MACQKCLKNKKETPELVTNTSAEVSSKIISLKKKTKNSSSSKIFSLKKN